MVGIKVGGTYSGLGAGSIVAVAVWLGTGVIVTVVVAVSDGIGDEVGVTDCPHAMNDKLITRKTMTRKRFFMLTAFLDEYHEVVTAN
jgi:hypothetical protein